MSLPKLVALVAGLLFLSSSAFATGITLSNVGGTYSTASNELQLSGATLTFVTGLGSPYDGNVSGDPTALSFSMGVPSTGTTASGTATWTSGGGSFAFSDTATSLSFSGTFTCTVSHPCTWSGTSATTAIFSGSFQGLLNGKPVTGLTGQLTFGGLNSGTTVATVVPEAGTLGLVGIGLLGMAGLTRRKWLVSVLKPQPERS